MTPNDKQKEIASLIRRQASFWTSTNDINSPTHYSDLDNDVDDIDWLNEAGKDDLKDILLSLYLFVREDYKKYNNT